jgi:hypothetical protein
MIPSVLNHSEKMPIMTIGVARTDRNRVRTS